ncbi:hypothetical protein PCC6912_39460 [Chlorogloeopsis fritschii PCC 6912]|uniref:HTH luxR-type domain-containing protein n=1 Tax=Chlorogloeopsis fritschii PCC 6912 TaxID=211165 RepID=A0A3S0ZTA4_CHLFR|nr:LuxR C-terminal-related transcriptional regulator [Chlorogloeopsis fritschii]RUR76987.1 hypothetical protein PCC6912_39460 [Chlorogloeopsis fritschii PCC 6912]
MDTSQYLTRRQQEIFDLVAQGFTNREIAHNLGISPKSVANQITAILGVFNITNRTQIVLIDKKKIPIGEETQLIKDEQIKLRNERIIKMYKEGYTARQIAERLGLHSGHIYKILRDSNSNRACE